MKPGVRAVGVAESFDHDDDRSTFAGVVTRANRVVDGVAFSTVTVGGTDATEGVVTLYDRLDREDVRYLLIAGIALAWFNVIDLHAIHEATERPILSITFEDSEGLERPLREQFEGSALDERLATYRDQPPRHEVTVDAGTVYVRAVGCAPGEAREIVSAFTPEGGRPEPLRVARLAARAANDLRIDPGH